MKRGSLYLAVALAASTFSLNSYSAIADDNPSPAPSISPFKSSQEQYKKDRDTFAAALRDREMKMRAINATFKSSVDKASLDAKTALTTATTPDQKNAINTARRSAIAAAIIARESAIAALGALPTPPAEPARPEKSATQGAPFQKERDKPRR